jgi:proline racemase
MGIGEGQIVKTLSIGKFDGIVGQVRGNARIIAYHQFAVDMTLFDGRIVHRRY